MSKTKRCEQCGREGTRGFTVIPAVTVDRDPYLGYPFTVSSIVTCTAKKACRRRWYKPSRRYPAYE